MGNVLKVYYEQEPEKSAVDKGSNAQTVDVAALDTAAVAVDTTAVVDTEAAVEATTAITEQSFRGVNWSRCFKVLKASMGPK